jgi:hypothetical protein
MIKSSVAIKIYSRLHGLSIRRDSWRIIRWFTPADSPFLPGASRLRALRASEIVSYCELAGGGRTN